MKVVRWDEEQDVNPEDEAEGRLLYLNLPFLSLVFRLCCEYLLLPPPSSPSNHSDHDPNVMERKAMLMNNHGQ